MTRVRYRFREYTLVPDEEPDAEPVTHTAQCAVCAEFGPDTKSQDDATGWIFAHVKDNPDHFTYRALVTLPYRVVPGVWQ